MRGPAFASEKRDGECTTACVRSDGAAVAGRKIERGEVVSGASDFRMRACLRGRQAQDRSCIRRRNGAAGLRGLRIVCGPVGGRAGMRWRRVEDGPAEAMGQPVPLSDLGETRRVRRVSEGGVCAAEIGGNRRRVRFRFLRRVRALPIFLSAHAFAAACRVKETGCLHRQAPRCHKEVAVGYLRMAATPGSSMPSMYSSSAPPPVDT